MEPGQRIAERLVAEVARRPLIGDRKHEGAARRDMDDGDQQVDLEHLVVGEIGRERVQERKALADPRREGQRHHAVCKDKPDARRQRLPALPPEMPRGRPRLRRQDDVDERKDGARAEQRGKREQKRGGANRRQHRQPAAAAVAELPRRPPAQAEAENEQAVRHRVRKQPPFRRRHEQQKPERERHVGGDPREPVALVPPRHPGGEEPPGHDQKHDRVRREKTECVHNPPTEQTPPHSPGAALSWR